MHLKRSVDFKMSFWCLQIKSRRLWTIPMCESHFCSLKAYFSLHYCIISNFNFQYFFFRTSMPLLFIFLPIVYALTFKVVHTNVQTLLDVRLVGTLLRTCEVPGLKLKQQKFVWILSRFIRFMLTSYHVSSGCILFDSIYSVRKF